ncbi:D-methionine transport system substrate-binding protein [Streptosporangium becharense]|uniref:Lipoprotein n=1 Tax=Streptosporangium becharense TaxID=1816182 RepID=A0A7W9IMH4_9ACTN|nr:MetQ/NlpA family ABC transporter substrate-binding protein [Streptosporangium becharense]MBB2915080.1 D-methionine transport system substrate-binding protein [Streptosporangium becharense]MBB5822848.1 D-methionine transport system substrate-binding protein [Streptosporangium becharense]
MRRLSAFTAVVTALVLTLAACGSDESTSTAGGGAAPAGEVLRVGASPVPHAAILTFVKDKLAAKEGLNLEIVEFTDYVQPNVQLDEGQLGANYFQHKPYLDDFNASKGTKLSFVQPVHLEPLGLYSKKVTEAAALGQGATVAVPNDATNLGRALKLLADNSLITLKDGVGTAATERDVTGNPKGLKFQPLEAAQLPRSLQDVDAAVINGNYALEGGLNPASDALLVEKAEGNPYANGLVVAVGKEKDPRVTKLAALLSGPEVKQFIEQTYKGAVIPATS